MSKAERLPAADIHVGDLVTLQNGTGYRVREVTPSALDKVIRLGALVEVTVPGGPELGRRFTIGKQTGTMVLVERAS
ncbi:hypothetical protein [Microterricola pindariensis]|uniref:Ferrous iron transport protein A n=1 Tax=Microterricola pindariensis TaxID=478010 RepID=A0ABX5AYD6_9MICO|nr:hypothetical protein [Microterricola pindariensis]PPL19817.1 hypothetical protein GY24_04155 [Microterricola pindariensis]